MKALTQLSVLTTLNATAPSFTAARRDGGARLLLIDDERAIWRALQRGLASATFEVACASTATHGLELVAKRRPDVVILELSLPDRDGLEVCRRLRTWSAVPIIVLSARHSEADKLMAFAEGVDDYVTKPFSMAELLARIRVALRHLAELTGSARGARFEVNRLCLDFERRQVTVDAVEVHLTPTEYELLKYLALHVGKVVTHRDLLRAVWGLECGDATHYLRVCVGHLRRKIEPEEGRSPRLLLTEPGIGYRLRGTETPRLQRCTQSMLGEHLETTYARSLAFRFPLPSCTELRRCGALPGTLLRLAK